MIPAMFQMVIITINDKTMLIELRVGEAEEANVLVVLYKVS